MKMALTHTRYSKKKAVVRRAMKRAGGVAIDSAIPVETLSVCKERKTVEKLNVGKSVVSKTLCSQSIGKTGNLIKITSNVSAKIRPMHEVAQEHLAYIKERNP